MTNARKFNFPSLIHLCIAEREVRRLRQKRDSLRELRRECLSHKTASTELKVELDREATK